MTREVKLYFEDAFPNLRRRWFATAHDDLDVEIASADGETAAEALEAVGHQLVRERDRKREQKKERKQAWTTVS